MRSLTILLMAFVLTCSSAVAQKTTWEIGTKVGVTLALPDSGASDWFVGVPGTGATLSAPSIYATIIPSSIPNLMIEPQVFLQYNTVSNKANTSLVLQVGWLLKRPENRSHSLYLAGNVGWLSVADSSDARLQSTTLGAALGWRFEVCTKVGLRGELLYRRWLRGDPNINEVTASFGAGILF